MKRFMHSAVLHGIIGAAMVCAAAACTQRSDCELVLDDFSEVVRIAPSDSVDLEQFGIFTPSSVIPYRDWLILKLSGGTHLVDIVKPSTEEKIECFRIGRGPGEINLVMTIQAIDSLLYVFDAGKQTYYTLDIERTIEERQQVLKDEIPLNSGNGVDVFNRPMFMYKYGSGYLSSFINGDNTWFCSLNDRFDIVTEIPLVDFRSTDELSALENSAFQLSSLFSASPGGTKGVAAMADCGTFSVFDINGDSLTERVRKIYYEPRLYSLEGKMISPAHDRSNTQAFYSAASTEENIYLLFSGKQLGDMTYPTYECNHLLVYDWDGNPVRRYELEKAINSIYLHDGRIYGSSMYPESRIYVYELPPQEDSVHGSVARPGR